MLQFILRIKHKNQGGAGTSSPSVTTNTQMSLLIRALKENKLNHYVWQNVEDRGERGYRPKIWEKKIVTLINNISSPNSFSFKSKKKKKMLLYLSDYKFINFSYFIKMT